MFRFNLEIRNIPFDLYLYIYLKRDIGYVCLCVFGAKEGERFLFLQQSNNYMAIFNERRNKPV